MASFITAGNATNGLQVSSDNTGILELRTGTGSGTTAVTFSTGQRATFPSTISVGNTTPATTGAGITFPAAQSASSDANTLDDYEEGTWLPGLNFSGGTTGITYSSRAGRYTKIGRIVTVSFYIKLTNKGSSTGNANVNGLPWAAYNASGAAPYYVGTVAGESGMATMPTGTYALAWSDSSLYLRSNGATSFSALTQANFTNTSEIYCTVTYEEG